MATEEKQVLVVEGYDPENLTAINPDDAVYNPGDRATITEGDYEGEAGIVKAVGYAGGLYGCIVADVLVDGTSEPERVPQDWLA